MKQEGFGCSRMSTRAGPDMPPGPVAVRTGTRSLSNMLVAISAKMPLTE